MISIIETQYDLQQRADGKSPLFNTCGAHLGNKGNEMAKFYIEKASLDMEFWETQLPSQWAGRTGVL